jgi:hypothetical protein
LEQEGYADDGMVLPFEVDIPIGRSVNITEHLLVLSLAGLSRRRLQQLATVKGGTPAVRVTVRARTASARTGVGGGDGSGNGGSGSGGGGSGGGGSGSGKNSKQRQDRLEGNGKATAGEEEEEDDGDGYFVLCEFWAPLGRLLLPPAAKPTVGRCRLKASETRVESALLL